MKTYKLVAITNVPYIPPLNKTQLDEARRLYQTYNLYLWDLRQIHNIYTAFVRDYKETLPEVRMVEKAFGIKLEEIK